MISFIYAFSMLFWIKSNWPIKQSQVHSQSPKPLLSQKNMKDRITFLAEYGQFDSECGSAELCRVMNQDFSCMLQRGVFWWSGEKYNSECISTTVKHGGRGVMVWGAFSAAVTVELLHSEKLMLWNTGEYCRKACFPQLKRCFLKGNNQMLFSQTRQCSCPLQRPLNGLRTSPSGSFFDLARVQIWTL